MIDVIIGMRITIATEKRKKPHKRTIKMNEAFQEHINRTINAARAAQFAASDQLSLGQIIDKLAGIPAREGKDEQRVVFDFEYAAPTGLQSWRGAYSELALTFDFEVDEMTLSAFTEMLRSAVGKTYEGYKGGGFTMTRKTPVWVANYGNSGSTAVIGVYDDGWQVVIQTGYRPN